MGLKPGAAKWKALTNPLRYGEVLDLLLRRQIRQIVGTTSNELYAVQLAHVNVSAFNCHLTYPFIQHTEAPLSLLAY